MRLMEYAMLRWLVNESSARPTPASIARTFKEHWAPDGIHALRHDYHDKRVCLRGITADGISIDDYTPIEKLKPINSPMPQGGGSAVSSGAQSDLISRLRREAFVRVRRCLRGMRRSVATTAWQIRPG
jgi:hypothetical protein